MNGFQQVPCPRCGSTANVHSIQELAGLARMQLGQMPGGFPAAGQPGGIPGYLQEPQPGVPGYRQEPRPGPVTGPAGRRAGRRMQRTPAGRVQPALAARGEERLRTQIAIAERHPDICACLDDHVVFLAGGQSVLPMPDLNTLTVDQADSMVATLRQT
ncbi:MAG: hypothetical protein ACR2FU_21880 [Streptosporangiaceae bacterium]